MLIAEEPASYACEAPDKRKADATPSDAEATPVEPSAATSEASSSRSTPTATSEVPPKPATNPDPDPGPDSDFDADSTRRFATELNNKGRTLHLAMALVEGVSVAAEDRQANVDRLRTLTQRAAGQNGSFSHDSESMSDDALTTRLLQLERSADRNLAEQLSLILLIEERELWRKAGCRDALHWMDRVLGIGRNSGFERLRVARALRSLPVIESLFAFGKLSWSKVRELTRVANPANEQALVAAALELSASETAALCQRWRHGDNGTENGEDDEDGSDGEGPGNAEAREARQAMRAWESRSLTWQALSSGNTRITLDLPNYLAAEFLKVLKAYEDRLREDEKCENEKRKDEQCEDKLTPGQRRADAALLMARSALAHAGEAVAAADRYRVFVNIDSRLLGNVDSIGGASPSGELPEELPTVTGFGQIAVATARRLASQARLTVVAKDAEGDVVATGSDTRLFSAATIRAITARDRCCQMPGCTHTRWLQAHHVVPWFEGGQTTMSNAALVCSGCHMQLHEGGLRLERVSKDSVALADEDELTMTSEERAASRAMIAALQRFRLVDREGEWLAGPRRRRRYDDFYGQGRVHDQGQGQSHGLASASDEFPRGNRSDEFPRGNRVEPLSERDELAQYRVVRE